MKQTLKYILSIIKADKTFAENKHGIVLAVSAAIVVFCATKLGDEFNLSIIFSTIAIALCSSSILLSLVAMTSRKIKVKKNKKIDIKKFAGSLLYFGDVAEFGEKEYLEAIVKKYKLPNDYKPDSFDKDLATEIIAESKIAKLKFKYFNYSIFFLVFGIAFVITSFALVAII